MMTLANSFPSRFAIYLFDAAENCRDQFQSPLFAKKSVITLYAPVAL